MEPRVGQTYQIKYSDCVLCKKRRTVKVLECYSVYAYVVFTDKSKCFLSSFNHTQRNRRATVNKTQLLPISIILR